MDDDFDELSNIADFTTFATGRKDARRKRTILTPRQRLQSLRNIGGSRGRRYKKGYKITLVQLKCLEKKE